MKREEYQDDRWKMRAAEIRELDHHQCALCGAKDVMLHVHHLSYPPPPFHIWDAKDNELVTLCEKCHVRIHESTVRPILSEDRHLTAFIKFHRDEATGERVVTPSLYCELYKRGYKGKPFTQQIIDWLREEHWLFIILSNVCLYEYEGRERACGFRVCAEIEQIRASCAYPVGEFDKYEEAEIEAIERALHFL